MALCESCQEEDALAGHTYCATCIVVQAQAEPGIKQLLAYLADPTSRRWGNWRNRHARVW